MIKGGNRKTRERQRANERWREIEKGERGKDRGERHRSGPRETDSFEPNAASLRDGSKETEKARERERERYTTHTTACIRVPSTRNSSCTCNPYKYARVRVQSRSTERRRDDGMNIAVPSRPVRPIRAKRELREGGTRCSFAYMHPWYLLFSLQIRGKNDLSPDAPAIPARGLCLSRAGPDTPEPGGGARRQRKKGKRREISAVNLLETPLA